MRIPFIPALLVAILCLIPSGMSHAAQPDQGLMKALTGNAKLHRSAHVLKDFYSGRTKTRVIVRLSEPSGFSGPASLRARSDRARVRNLMRDHAQGVVKNLDSSNVRVRVAFNYQPGFAAEVSLKGLNHLAARSDVLSIEHDEPLYPHDVQGLSVINGATLRGVYNGQGVAIAICDTGIDYTHAMLGGSSFPNAKILGGYDVGDGDADPMDLNGHGTKCAGIAAGSWDSVDDYNGGVAYGAKLYAVKITTGSSGSSSLSAMVSAWEWCITHQYDNSSYPILVISTSFGGTAYTAACDSASPSMTLAAANAVAAGMSLFASSGNDGYCNAVSFPACVSSVNSVGAVLDANLGGLGWCVVPSSCAANKQRYASCGTGTIAWLYSTSADMVPPYSNTASFLTMLAPSNNAYTTSTGGGYSSNFGGTSAACPYAAGAAACVQSAAKAATGAFLTPAAVKSKMLAAGDPVTYATTGITKPRVNLWKVDSDGDGMPDGWEIQYLDDVTHTAAEDYDRDGLTNLQEYTHGTNPTLFDTDGDGYSDGVEVTAGTDPLDAGSHPNAVPAMGLPLMSITIGLLAVCTWCYVSNKNRNPD